MTGSTPVGATTFTLILLSFFEGTLVIGPHLAHAPSSAPTTRRFSALSKKCTRSIENGRRSWGLHSAFVTIDRIAVRGHRNVKRSLRDVRTPFLDMVCTLLAS